MLNKGGFYRQKKAGRRGRGSEKQTDPFSYSQRTEEGFLTFGFK